MPGQLSGFDLAQIAMSRHPTLRVLLTSGFPEARITGNGNKPIGLRLLSKPYRRAELARTLRDILDS